MRMYNFKVLITLFLLIFTSLPLIAEKEPSSELLAQTDSNIVPDVPTFSLTYQGEVLVCVPTGLIKNKRRKELVTYQCQKEYSDNKNDTKQDEARGNEETQRMRNEVRNRIEEGVKYSVEIPLYDANSPSIARLIAKRQLNNSPHGQYLRMLLPAKIYLSARPQYVADPEGIRDGGSRGGFFYYYQFDTDLELAFQYEAKIDWDNSTPFVNTSHASDTPRRLSYLALKYGSNSIILGKYWSAYYDIASLTDHYMAFGAQASGAFNRGTDGGPSGTGRPDEMLQVRRNRELYDATLQVQLKQNTLMDLNTTTDYTYTVGGSFIYKGLENFKAGISISYGKFDEITPDMRSVGIDGNDWASIVGLAYKKDNFSINTTFSYMKNHMTDDQGIYFDGIGTEIYMRYDIDESLRIAGGGNLLLPTNNDYMGEYSIKDIILSLQYTFGEKTFDDLVYVEVSLPNGKLANGNSRDANIAIGLRYLLDN